MIVLAGQKSMASALPEEWNVRETGVGEDGEESVMMTEARLRMPGAMAFTTSSMESVGGGVGDGGGAGAAEGGVESAASGEMRPRERARKGRRRMGCGG